MCCSVPVSDEEIERYHAQIRDSVEGARKFSDCELLVATIIATDNA